MQTPRIAPKITPEELRDRISDLCRQHKWDQAAHEIEARDEEIREEERARAAKIVDAARGTIFDLRRLRDEIHPPPLRSPRIDRRAPA